MATTPMTFKIEIPDQEWYRHSLRKEWISIHHTHPTMFTKYLAEKHNIHLIGCNWTSGLRTITLTFKSTQDYILWQLHQ